MASWPQILFQCHLPQEALHNQIRALITGSYGSICAAFLVLPQVPFYIYFHDYIIEFVSPHFPACEPRGGGSGVLCSSLTPSTELGA